LIKTTDELTLLRRNGRVGEEMLGALRRAIRPGATEHELWATMASAAFALGAEGMFTRVLSSGSRTNPWLREASERRVEKGDVVAVDTDAYGIEGYLIDVSRTFLVGATPSSTLLDAYRFAVHFVDEVLAAVRPGRTYGDIARLGAAIPDKYWDQRYDCVIHGCGLEDEGPLIPATRDEQTLEVLDGQTIREGMVLSIECYAGEVGGSVGVKYEEQVEVTNQNAIRLCRFPPEDNLLR
jgi:Xaa-Pro aminopeptidase